MENDCRLIDANALCEGLVENHPVVIYAMAAPTVDAVEVVHGWWLNSHTVAFTEECSQCGFCVPWDDDGCLHKYNYCPNCGAKMDGDGNEKV